MKFDLSEYFFFLNLSFTKFLLILFFFKLKLFKFIHYLANWL